MRKIFTVLVLLSSLIGSVVSAADFNSRLKLQVLNYDGKKLSLKVTETNDNFPASTVLYSTITEHKPNRRLMRSEYIKANITEAVFPNGTKRDLNRQLKIRTKRFGGKRAVGNSVVGTAGLVLGITIDFITVGLPVARGGLGLWNAGYNIHEKDADESAFIEGGKGFLSGVLFPLPQLVLKSKKLDLETGSEVVFMSTDDDDQVKGIALVI
ncbi:MAG: hypothetical protein HOA17_00325 [Candidatus Melainabacteria bacterium]|jgi:hypothetical protein|nr:hypothetical protein [Candidatus Melainabacteria bacterium]